MSEFLEDLKDIFSKYADPEKAIPMEKYMKNKFSFLGIKQDVRRTVFKEFIKTKGLPSKEVYEELVIELFDCREREFQYCGMELMKMMKKSWNKTSIRLIEHAIVNQSWWDTVDYIAVHLAGNYFQLFPENTVTITEKWMNSNNIWLQRSAILFQLKYKEKTNTAQLFDYISRLADSKEFFIRKACGWALREYAKTDKAAVKKFVDSVQLSGLTQREALKHFK